MKGKQITKKMEEARLGKRNISSNFQTGNGYEKNKSKERKGRSKERDEKKALERVKKGERIK